MKLKRSGFSTPGIQYELAVEQHAEQSEQSYFEDAGRDQGLFVHGDGPVNQNFLQDSGYGISEPEPCRKYRI